LRRVTLDQEDSARRTKRGRVQGDRRAPTIICVRRLRERQNRNVMAPGQRRERLEPRLRGARRGATARQVQRVDHDQPQVGDSLEHGIQLIDVFLHIERPHLAPVRSLVQEVQAGLLRPRRQQPRNKHARVGVRRDHKHRAFRRNAGLARPRAAGGHGPDELCGQRGLAAARRTGQQREPAAGNAIRPDPFRRG
jgi:hypothetical protein